MNRQWTDDEYFHDSVTGGHRTTPPTADGRRLDTWEADLARHLAKCTIREGNTMATETILGMTRLKNSGDGNPRWEIRTTNGAFRTEKDAQVGHLVSEEWIGRKVWLTVNGNGQIIAVNDMTEK